MQIHPNFAISTEYDTKINYRVRRTRKVDQGNIYGNLNSENYFKTKVNHTPLYVIIKVKGPFMKYEIKILHNLKSVLI